MKNLIFKNWLCNLNEKMKIANRKILLIGDNAGMHFEYEYSNIKMESLPKIPHP
jgi:hypothetical protein